MLAIASAYQLTLPPPEDDARPLESMLEEAGLPAPLRAHLLEEAGPLTLALRAQRRGDPGLLAALADGQRDDGSFGGVTATAACVRALVAAGHAPELRAAGERGLEWLVALQLRGLGEGGTGLLGSDLDTLGMLWQLGRHRAAWSLNVPALVESASAVRLAQREPFASIVSDLQRGLWSAMPIPPEVVSLAAALAA